MLAMLYGYTPSPHTPDALARLINEVMEDFSKAIVVGAWMVEVIPWLQFLPTWVPGTGFKKTAQQWRKDSGDCMNLPVKSVKQKMSQNSAKPSRAERLLRANPNAEDKMDTEQTAAALYAGRAYSNAVGLSFFFLTMTAFPEVQAKAREEVDRVVGSERLPGFQDRDNMPYIEAVIKETLLWHSLALVFNPPKSMTLFTTGLPRLRHRNYHSCLVSIWLFSKLIYRLSTVYITPLG
ncbi:cytochrome P450 [Massarina eburnea CBS 473.64]|uniref:Cytochrome P450 n=1 Tax=Massarina eburnea CBS 473.64 TaxID=1395130 RepID=A0A6A6RSV5_9PLEO|nr:cytochrome P450 [Massarina eburnea CBS 473.64]